MNSQELVAISHHLDLMTPMILNEFVVSEILDVYKEILDDTLKGKITESGLLESENYAKLVVCIDEMISQVTNDYDT
jgi:hypothetical protein